MCCVSFYVVIRPSSSVSIILYIMIVKQNVWPQEQIGYVPEGYPNHLFCCKRRRSHCFGKSKETKPPSWIIIHLLVSLTKEWRLTGNALLQTPWPPGKPPCPPPEYRRRYDRGLYTGWGDKRQTPRRRTCCIDGRTLAGFDVGPHPFVVVRAHNEHDVAEIFFVVIRPVVEV